MLDLIPFSKPTVRLYLVGIGLTLSCGMITNQTPTLESEIKLDACISSVHKFSNLEIIMKKNSI